ncbi:Armadillo-like helical domain containing protein [Gracilaria domingensis]|nr:Armadillo-like helical domain containing protein [Gracilaria domingensis]
MRVPQACFTLICNPRSDVRNEVLNALLHFVGRTFPSAIVSEGDFNPTTAFRQVFLGLLNVAGQTPLVLAPLSRSLVPPTDAFPPLKEAWFKSAPIESVDEEAHEFTVKFFEVLSKLGTTHFPSSFLARTNHANDLSNNDRELAAAFVDLMTAGLTCPSYVLRETVFIFFTSTTAYVSRKEIRSELALFLVTRFLHGTTAGVLKFARYPEVDKYGEVDYDGDDVSLTVARRKLNGHMYGALRTVTHILPEVSALFILSRFVRLISLQLPNSKYPLVSGPRGPIVCPDSDGQSWNFGDVVDRRAWRYCIDTTYPTVDAICQAAANKVSAEVRIQMIALQRQAFEVIIAWNDVELLVPKIHALRVLFLLYSTEPQKLDACIEAFASIIDNPNTPTTARSRACVSLRSVYRRLSQSKDAHIGRFANMLCDYAVNTLLNPKFRDQDKMQLVEASVACVMSIPGAKEAEQKIERMLMPLINTLSSAKALSVFQSPVTFLEFLMKGSVDEVSPIVCAFNVLSSSMHQISRPVAKEKGSKLNLTSGMLSHAIAPKAVEVVSVLLPTLHAFFNPAKFPRDKTDKLRYNVLLPTCKYLVYLVNLDSSEILKRVGDGHESYEERPRAFREGPSVQEERSYDILSSYGIDPPDRQFAWIRETLHSLRISGYETIRACVLSGVTKSPTHLNTLLRAFCMDFQCLEPYHLLGIVSRILGPLLSFSIVSADPSFLENVAQSEVPKLLHHVGEHIAASIQGADTFSDTSALDIYRGCCRSWLRRAATNLISGMYPFPGEKNEPVGPQFDEYFPPQFQVPVLGAALYSLWLSACNPGKDANDKTSFQFPFAVISRAAGVSPRSQFHFFGRLLEASFRAAVLNAGETSTTVDAPVGAMFAIIRKWPVESGRQLEAALGQSAVLQQWVSECIHQIASTDQVSKPKKQKSLLRNLVNRIADHEGTAFKKEKKVNVLPEKLVAINAKRSAKRARGDLDELELGEGALDSLFGEGDPL